MSTPSEILAFWFAEGPDTHRTCWFRRSEAFDNEIREKFGAVEAEAHAGRLDAWTGEPDGTLALVILLDQFPRNLFRGQARAFASDTAARRLARSTIASCLDVHFTPTQRVFLYLPFEHSEERSDQDLSVALFEGLRDVPAMAKPGGSIDFAWRHRAVIRQFGRFPHRNKALNRTSTPEETAWLAAGGGF